MSTSAIHSPHSQGNAYPSRQAQRLSFNNSTQIKRCRNCTQQTTAFSSSMLPSDLRRSNLCKSPQLLTVHRHRPSSFQRPSGNLMVDKTTTAITSQFA